MKIKANKLDPFHVSSKLSFYICMMNVEVDVRIYLDNSFQNWIQNLKSDILLCVVTVLTFNEDEHWYWEFSTIYSAYWHIGRVMIRNNRPQPSGQVGHHYYLATSYGKNPNGYSWKMENRSRFWQRLSPWLLTLKKFWNISKQNSKYPLDNLWFCFTCNYKKNTRIKKASFFFQFNSFYHGARPVTATCLTRGCALWEVMWMCGWQPFSILF